MAQLEKQHKRALIRVDMQNDFVLPGAPLSVPDAISIIPIINRLSQLSNYDCVIDTKDWHPSDHLAFATNHKGKKPFDIIELEGVPQVLWPVHCVQNTEGAEFHPDLYRGGKMTAVFLKGQNKRIHPYSGFGDKSRHDSTGLADFLQESEIKYLDICGVALPQFCVGCTALDAVKEGFTVRIVEDACRAIPGYDYGEFMQQARSQGVEVVQSSQVGFH